MTKCVEKAKIGTIGLCQNRQKWVWEFLPRLAEIRLADSYQYWRLNIHEPYTVVRK